MNDKEREDAIDTAFLRFQGATDPVSRKAAWAEVQRLVMARSPAQVKRMEQEKGLCR